MAYAGRDAHTLAGIPVEVRWADPADDAAVVAAGNPRHLLTPFEFARYESLRPDAARVFLAGRSLLRDLVAALAAVEPADVAIEARCPVCGGPHGRPTVVSPPAATPLQLSLAHSGAVVVAAAAWDHPVGVDVERADAAHAPERDDAIAAVAGASGDDALEHWTRVEAVLKADGRGLRVDPGRVRIRTAGDAPGDTADAWIDGDDASPHYALARIDLGPGFTASVAIRT